MFILFCFFQTQKVHPILFIRHFPYPFRIGYVSQAPIFCDQVCGYFALAFATSPEKKTCAAPAISSLS